MRIPKVKRSEGGRLQKQACPYLSRATAPLITHRSNAMSKLATCGQRESEIGCLLDVYGGSRKGKSESVHS